MTADCCPSLLIEFAALSVAAAKGSKIEPTSRTISPASLPIVFKPCPTPVNAELTPVPIP